MMEYDQDGPEGWALRLNGKVSIRTASWRAEAAMINAVILFGGVDWRATSHWTDQDIRRAWAQFQFANPTAALVEVTLVQVFVIEGELVPS